MGRLQGKVAVVTGGSSGIGLAVAKRLVDEGAHVFITGRRASELEKAKADLGRNVTAVQGDVAKLEDLDRLYATVKAEKGSVDIIIANAGIVEFIPFEETTVGHFDNTFGVNARGTYFTVHKALPLLKDGASIVLIGSTAHLSGVPVLSTYAATKAAIRSFARTWTSALASRRIRVNTVSPGATDTPIFDTVATTKEQSDAMKAGMAADVPLGRIARPEEIASAVFFLASDEGSFVNGVDLAVDGGASQI